MYTLILLLSILIIIIILGTGRRCNPKIGMDDFLSKGYTNALRGAAIVMIMFGHTAGKYSESVWFSPLASTGVTLFLLMSGYGNNESYKMKGRFMFKRIYKILIPYWITIILLSIIDSNKMSGHDIVCYIFLLKPYISGYWFVTYITHWYIVYWVALNFFYKKRWAIFIFASLISFLFAPPLKF